MSSDFRLTCPVVDWITQGFALRCQIKNKDPEHQGTRTSRNQNIKEYQVTGHQRPRTSRNSRPRTSRQEPEAVQVKQSLLHDPTAGESKYQIIFVAHPMRTQYINSNSLTHTHITHSHRYTYHQNKTIFGTQ